MAHPAGAGMPLGDETHAHAPHVVPLTTYYAVFAALLFGTWLTVWAAGQDFGAFNTLVALAIATTKATLVILFFMHVKYSPRLTQLVVTAAVLWLIVLFSITMHDYYSPTLDGTVKMDGLVPKASLKRE